MAWYDNLQYPDYARHYENQGKIYSDLLNSLSKIGGEYLTQQREVKAGKDFETAKRELRDKNTTQVPAVAEQPFRAGSPYIPAVQGYQPEPIGIGQKFPDYLMDEAIMSSPAVQATPEIPYRAAVPASTNFNQTGYDKGLLDLLSRMYTSGDKTQKNLATEAVTMYELQDKIRKASQNITTQQDPTKTTVITDPYGNVISKIEGKEEQKGVMLINQTTGRTQFFPYGSQIPEGFVPTTTYNTGQNVESREKIAGMNIAAQINAAKTLEDFKANQSQLDRNHETTLTKIKELGIQGRDDIKNAISMRGQLVGQYNGSIGFSGQEENLRNLQTQINDINAYLDNQSKEKTATKSTSSGGGNKKKTGASGL